jgi:hypothetical protein
VIVVVVVVDTEFGPAAPVAPADPVAPISDVQLPGHVPEAFGP